MVSSSTTAVKSVVSFYDAPPLTCGGGTRSSGLYTKSGIIESGSLDDYNAPLVLDDDELLFHQLRQEALDTLEAEPELSHLLHQTVLAPCVTSFDQAVARTICHRLLPSLQLQTGSGCFCPHAMLSIFHQAFECTSNLELGHTMSQAVRRDALCVLERDPACDTLLEVVLFFKGFAALVCHRAARYKWYQTLSTTTTSTNVKRTSMTALFLQSQASAVFGVDIHPAATMGAGILLDHGTGIVIGETAILEDGCTLLHGVTLGGTGKDSGDRHPKIGAYTFIGAGTCILGNIRIGKGCKIGAGSVVLRGIPDGATAVGAPAKIVGHAVERRPSIAKDDTLQQVAWLHRSTSVNRELDNEQAAATEDAASNPSVEATTITSDSTPESLSGSSKEEGTQEEPPQLDDEGNKEESAAAENQVTNDIVTIQDNPATTTTTTISKVGSQSARQVRNVSFTPNTTKARNNTMNGHSTNQLGHLKEVCNSGDDDDNSEDDSGDKFSMCPFRAYAKIKAPPGAWNICQFKQWLCPHGISLDEIHSLFFALDGPRNVGYIYWDHLRQVCHTILPQHLSCLQQQQQQDNNSEQEQEQFLQLVSSEIPTTEIPSLATQRRHSVQVPSAGLTPRPDIHSFGTPRVNSVIDSSSNNNVWQGKGGRTNG